ncbi:Oidioi.mRNA.OKI2018_I69.chr2.g5294.t1.cds [Oikopleura dioica]|uniref:Oidioi.mRNA.OKI2018_I69.chr2.g5294.t1.cds n=1 Tax=Oikopleura dioica TaxID=34765 RepID=A0ABN7T6K5_OIKDI|nr:Oidioi.mRNA.OKI2018_I69.chr2.g5294.t1.cds [Oikopleura dioica]
MPESEYLEDLEENTPYPYHVFFIIGNEFCERYAYYGMRSILIIFLTYFLGFSKDESTIIYHSYIAMCYFFPLIGGIIADSCLGKFWTILNLSIVYLAGMVMMTVSAVPFGDDNSPNNTNTILAICALITVAMGTGGIKPCVAALGGDQFKDTKKGKEQLSGFFSLFYASINAGSLMSTFVSPILRELQCFDRADCYAIAFVVPACLMFVAIIAFVAGSKKYIIKPSKGNVFGQFISAVCPCGDKSQYTEKQMKEYKSVLPIIVMYIPLPFFWALFSMQGSRWTLSATQTNGWVGNAKIRPDQMQIMNPIMILAFLPLFQYCVYPAIEWCGFKMTSLRRMSAGQLTTALAFLVAGFVQLAIDDGLTPIPDYKTQNSLRVMNGLADADFTVSSSYWDFLGDEYPVGGYSVKPNIEEFRTETHAKIRDDLPKNEVLKINAPGKFDFDISLDEIEHETINSFMVYKNESKYEYLWYVSPKEKSGSMRVRAVLLNPSGYYLRYHLVDKSDGSEKRMVVDKTISPFSKEDESTEFDRGNFQIKAYFMKDPIDDDITDEELELQKEFSCVSDFWDANNWPYHETSPFNSEFPYGTGSIWSFMAVQTGNGKCEVRVGLESNANDVNIFLLLPQYIVITAGEVMNSVTGLEFAYTQAPKSMKSVVQSFWLLTTCLGNIIDIFLVELKLHPTQSGEYFILSAIMASSTTVFILLAIFYYEYVDPSEFDEEPPNELDEKVGEKNEAFDKESVTDF